MNGSTSSKHLQIPQRFQEGIDSLRLVSRQVLAAASEHDPYFIACLEGDN